jgi:phosphoglycolate phosphatase
MADDPPFAGRRSPAVVVPLILYIGHGLPEDHSTEMNATKTTIADRARRAPTREQGALAGTTMPFNGARLRQTPSIELLRPDVSAKDARVCLFDFDGTLSLIRSGWIDVMIPMMVEILLDLKTGESEEELRAAVEDYVWLLTGKQTIYQMMALADRVRTRGGNPLEPLAYKRMYLDRLHLKIRDRLEALRAGKESPDKYLVPGSRALLDALRNKGLRLYLASGTDQDLVRDEARLLDISDYFDGGVYGALDDYQSFSKRMLIRRVIESAAARGSEFLGFGDGYVEIENIKEVGGVAVGVATSEPECLVVDEWKRGRLAGAGADLIVPNFLGLEDLLRVLFNDHQISAL